MQCYSVAAHTVQLSSTNKASAHARTDHRRLQAAIQLGKKVYRWEFCTFYLRIMERRLDTGSMGMGNSKLETTGIWEWDRNWDWNWNWAGDFFPQSYQIAVLNGTWEVTKVAGVFTHRSHHP